MSIEQQLQEQWSSQLKILRGINDTIKEIANMEERKQYHYATINAESMRDVIEDMFHTASHFGMVGKQSEKTMVMRARNTYMETLKNLIKKYDLDQSLAPTRPKEVRPLPQPRAVPNPAPRVQQPQQRLQQQPQRQQQQQPNRVAQVQNVIVRHGPAAARFVMNNRHQIMRHMQNAYNMAHDALDGDEQQNEQQYDEQQEPQEYEQPVEQYYEEPQQDYSGGGDYGGGEYEY